MTHDELQEMELEELKDDIYDVVTNICSSEPGMEASIDEVIDSISRSVSAQEIKSVLTDMAMEGELKLIKADSECSETIEIAGNKYGYVRN